MELACAPPPSIYGNTLTIPEPPPPRFPFNLPLGCAPPPSSYWNPPIAPPPLRVPQPPRPPPLACAPPPPRPLEPSRPPPPPVACAAPPPIFFPSLPVPSLPSSSEIPSSSSSSPSLGLNEMESVSLSIDLIPVAKHLFRFLEAVDRIPRDPLKNLMSLFVSSPLPLSCFP